MIENQNSSKLFVKKVIEFGKTLSTITRSVDYDTTVNPTYYEAIMSITGRMRLGGFVANNLHGYLPVVNENGAQSQVLDIAAGTGSISASLSQEGYKVIAADSSQ